VAFIERPKARCVSASGPDQGICQLHIALLIPFHYLIPFMTLVWHLCDRVIVSIMSFHDWKSRGILLQKTCRNPDISLLAKRHCSYFLSSGASATYVYCNTMNTHLKSTSNCSQWWMMKQWMELSDFANCFNWLPNY